MWLNTVNFIKDLDFMSDAPKLLINRKSNLTSIYGALISILVFGMTSSAIYLFGKEMFVRKHPTSYFNEIDLSESIFNLREMDFNVYFTLKKQGKLDNMENNSITTNETHSTQSISKQNYQVKASILNLEFMNTSQNSEILVLNKSIGFQSQLASFNNFPNFQLTTQDIFYLQFKFDHSLFNHSNPNDYYSLVVNISDNLIRISDFEETLKRINYTLFFNLHQNFNSLVTVPVSLYDIVSDVGFILYSYNRESTFQIGQIDLINTVPSTSSSTSSIDIPNESNEKLITLKFIIHRKKVEIYRNYIKLHILLSDVGGFQEFFSFLASLLYYFYKDVNTKLYLVNKYFDIPNYQTESSRNRKSSKKIPKMSSKRVLDFVKKDADSHNEGNILKLMNNNAQKEGIQPNECKKDLNSSMLPNSSMMALAENRVNINNSALPNMSPIKIQTSMVNRSSNRKETVLLKEINKASRYGNVKQQLENSKMVHQNLDLSVVGNNINIQPNEISRISNYHLSNNLKSQTHMLNSYCQNQSSLSDDSSRNSFQSRKSNSFSINDEKKDKDNNNKAADENNENINKEKDKKKDVHDIREGEELVNNTIIHLPKFDNNLNLLNLNLNDNKYIDTQGRFLSTDPNYNNDNDNEKENNIVDNNKNINNINKDNDEGKNKNNFTKTQLENQQNSNIDTLKPIDDALNDLNNNNNKIKEEKKKNDADKENKEMHEIIKSPAKKGIFGFMRMNNINDNNDNNKSKLQRKKTFYQINNENILKSKKDSNENLKELSKRSALEGGEINYEKANNTSIYSINYKALSQEIILPKEIARPNNREQIKFSFLGEFCFCLLKEEKNKQKLLLNRGFEMIRGALSIENIIDLTRNVAKLRYFLLSNYENALLDYIGNPIIENIVRSDNHYDNLDIFLKSLTEEAGDEKIEFPFGNSDLVEICKNNFPLVKISEAYLNRP